MQRACGSIVLEITARPISFDGVVPFWNLPLERCLGFRARLGQVDDDALTRRLHVADIHQIR